MWQLGDRLSHRFNPDLGPGRIVEVSGRRVRVEFPLEGEILSFANDADALAPLHLTPGSRVRVEATGEVASISEVTASGDAILEDGRRLTQREIWPLPESPSPVDQLARGEVGAWEDFANRLDGLRLQQLRQADGLGSFLGGRIQLFPHQLYVAERACREDGAAGRPVRWLLADEVGLGKTVEACLIMNRLIHTGRAERTLVVAPASLTVQWLGELWRKHHQIFVLLDEQRLRDVERDYGAGFNPFEVHRQVIVSQELIASHWRLSEQAVEVGVDLLVVDEAHHLKRRAGHPGNALYRAIQPITAQDRNVLLLTATPLEEDAHGFYRLVQLLRPAELPEDSFDERLASQRPLPPCTSATRRVDVGGLPPRQGEPVEVDAFPDDPAAPLEDSDPRLAWLVEAARRWRRQGDKTLVFVARREHLDFLKRALEQHDTARVGIFHEELSLKRRDVEVAQFRLADGPAILISTECGGEGRNFQFCRRLVLFDLPWSPAVVEQRIGRLDRIGRSLPTEIVYFRPACGLAHAVARLYEGIGLFREPLGGLERELRHVEQAIAGVAHDSRGRADSAEIDPAVFDSVLAEARQAGARVREAAFHALHHEPYRQDMAEEILRRVPPDLDSLNEDVVLRAAARFGFEVEQQSGERRWLIEHGAQALVDHLPGMPVGARYLGTFDRATAVDDETLDYLASGHPLVEGVLAELEDGERGRVALLQVPGDEEVFGLLAVYGDGAGFELVAIDTRGRRRDDLAKRFAERGFEREHVKSRSWTSQPGWERNVQRLAQALPEADKPVALAAFRVRRVVSK
ncbi:MAG: helicase-related protein [Acidobacteriota bacterium]